MRTRNRGWLTVVLLALLALAPSGVGAQEEKEKAAVLETVERFMMALSARDSMGLKAVMAPEGRFTIAVVNGDSAVIRSQTHAAAITSIGRSAQPLLERFWDATVLIAGPLAVVKAPYDFHAGGRFSHCGTDIFMLARDGGEWKITSASYTVVRTGCAPSPLGPPKS